MAEGDDAYQRYVSYDWDSDRQWEIHRLNVYVPPGSEENTALWEKIKRKYYQRHVDPTIIFPGDVPQPSYTPPSFSSSSSASSSSSSTYTSSSSSYSPPPPSYTSTPSSSTSSSYNSSSQQPQFSFSSPVGMMSVAWLAANMYLLLRTVLFIFTGAGAHYSGVLLAAIVSYILNLLATFGLPQFNMAYWTRLAQHESVHYLALCFVFLSYPPVLLVAPLISIYAFFNTCNFLQHILPQFGSFASGTVLPLISKALTFQQRAFSAAANLEVFLMPLLIFKLFFGEGGFLMVLMYWQFLNYRYLANANVRMLLTLVGQKMDGFVNTYVPSGIRSYYFSVRQFFARFVDPAAMQQTYQRFTQPPQGGM